MHLPISRLIQLGIVGYQSVRSFQVRGAKASGWDHNLCAWVDREIGKSLYCLFVSFIVSRYHFVFRLLNWCDQQSYSDHQLSAQSSGVSLTLSRHDPSEIIKHYEFT